MNPATITTSIVQPTKLEVSIKDNTVFFEISLQVVGVKRRCRKVERHFFTLGYIPYNNGSFNQSEIEDKVRAFLETNMKQVNSMTRVSLYHTVITKDEFCTQTTWQPYSDKNVNFHLNIIL